MFLLIFVTFEFAALVLMWSVGIRVRPLISVLIPGTAALVVTWDLLMKPSDLPAAPHEELVSRTRSRFIEELNLAGVAAEVAESDCMMLEDLDTSDVYVDAGCLVRVNKTAYYFEVEFYASGSVSSSNFEWRPVPKVPRPGT